MIKLVIILVITSFNNAIGFTIFFEKTKTIYLSIILRRIINFNLVIGSSNSIVHI